MLRPDAPDEPLGRATATRGTLLQTRGMITAAGDEALARAVALLRRGELVAFPTETVYGLGADARNADAVRAIFAAKGRPADHPVIVHLASAAELPDWAAHVPSSARLLAAAFWPGPLTLIVPRAAGVSDAVTGGQDTVGLRVPAHPVAQALLRAFGGGIAGPSANRFGRISPTTAAHVAEDLGDRVALILDGGACDVGIESTIVACVDERPVLLRPGGVSVEALERVLGRTPGLPDAQAPRASGTLASHYAPRTPARLVSTTELQALAGGPPAVRRGVLARTLAEPSAFAGTWLAAPRDAAGYAHALYANLRALDAAGVDEIVIEQPPAEDAWLPVRDRLQRATHAAAADDIEDMD